MTHQTEVSPARLAAARVLLRVAEGGYAHLALEGALARAEASGMGERDRALLHALVYGVLRRRVTLDFVIAACCDRDARRKPAVTVCLHIGAYQLLYMDRVPGSAAAAQAVELARALGADYAAGFVNAVMRRVAAEGRAVLDALPDTPEHWAVRYACPEAIVGLWRGAYGDAHARALLEAMGEQPAAYVRVNTLKIGADAFGEALAAALALPDAEEARIPGLPAGFCIKSTGFGKRLAKSFENCYYYQDAASQWCCAALEACPGERVADVCAAPGGKSLTLAQYMDNRGYLLAGELHAARCDAMAARLAAMGASVAHTVCRDAAAPWPEGLRGSFDRVLCDVPCSGLGVLRRKPEIRAKSPDEWKGLPELQYRILSNAAALVRPGGALQYATCTLRPAENGKVAARFLREHPDFAPRALTALAGLANPLEEPDWQRTLMPHVHGTDGFFVAGFTRVGRD